MNRLKKKCIIVTVGIHLLLLVTLLVGPAFFSPKPKVDDLQVLDVIPATAVDAAFNSGVRNAEPPKQTVQPPELPKPSPPEVKPEPAPTLIERVEKIFKPEPPKETPQIKPDLTPVEKPEKPQHKIQVNTELVTRKETKNSTSKPTPDDSQSRAQAFRNAARAIREKTSSATTVDMPGDSSVAYANYASIVQSIYQAAWTAPDSADNDEANTKVSVTIASDGTVLNARVTSASGDRSVDDSVRRTLERVKFIQKFPEGTTDKQRTYIINFNLKAKRMTG